ncbi:heterokaryon incompatibility protein-domain-containing protein [Cadophora sp. MPI-SDFR-AT-0126]|nr:heterokaryon incompatibility protein-domain-containing protein [Leotiomycetes sp. MPI-SDFR-AT-0126]
MTTPLCSLCTTLFTSTPLPSPPPGPYSPIAANTTEYLLLESTTHSFALGAENGCRFCTLCKSSRTFETLHDLDQTGDLKEEERWRLRFLLVIVDEESENEEGTEVPLYPRVKIQLGGGPEGRYFDDVWTVQMIPTGEFKLELDGSTGSIASLDIAKSWLARCNEHEDCQLYKQQVRSGQSPSRLLDVGSTDSPRLRVTEEDIGNAQYATLSHCWRRYMPLKLLASNIEAMKLEVHAEELAPNFRDAVAVCRHLGLRYLWVDSLCIVQDSAEDWLNESGRMHSVYSNAVLNICATAKDPTCLFTQRDNKKLSIYWSPLNRRAWVLQERLLSQRNLHFGHNQLFWECQKFIACELTPDGFVGGVRPPYYYQKRLSLEHGALLRDADGLPPDEALNPFAIWNAVVRTYSSCALTFKTDKLIAVSALARHCQTQLGLEGQYLAGLWSKYLGNQLLWETHPYLHGKRQKTYRAPTWSWASMDDVIFEACNIEFSDERDIIIEVKGWKMDLVSTDIYGPVSSGYICISGRLARVVVCVDTTDEDHPEYDLKVMLDCIIPTKGTFQKDTLFADDTDTFVIDLYHDLLVMPIRKGIGHDNRGASGYDGWGPHSWEGLVLKPVEGKQGTFHRLGKYTMIAKEDEILFENAFKDFDLGADGHDLESISNGDGGNLYTVKME